MGGDGVGEFEPAERAHRPRHAQQPRSPLRTPWSVIVLLVWAGFAVSLRHPALPERWGGVNGFDYRDTFYVPIRDLMAGHMPWDYPTYHLRHPTSQMTPMYLPSYWLVSMPFLLLPYRVGLLLWIGVLSLAAVAFVAAMAAELLPRLPRRRKLAAEAILLAFTLVTPPLRSGILAANWAPLCAIAAMGALWYARRWTPWPDDRRRRVALVALTCLAIVKPQVGLPLLILQLCLGAWRVAAVAWGISAVLALPIGIMALRASGSLSALVSAFRNTLSKGEGLSITDGSSTRIDLLGALGHLDTYPSGIVSALWVLAILAVTLTSVLLAARLHREPGLFLAASAMALLLVAPNLLYGAPVLVPPLVALAVDILRGGRCRERTPKIVVWLLMFFPFVNLRSFGHVFGYRSQLTNAANGLVLNVCALLVLVAVLRVRARRAASTDADAVCTKVVPRRALG